MAGQCLMQEIALYELPQLPVEDRIVWFGLSARMEIETPKQPSLGRPILRSTMQASFGTN